MDVRVGDKLIMKKNHPCGSNEFEVYKRQVSAAAARSWFRASRRRKTSSASSAPRRISIFFFEPQGGQ